MALNENQAARIARPEALLHGRLSDRILKTFFQVHYELGAGYPEAIYSAAMVIALRGEGLRVEREVPVAVHFRGARIGSFRVDTVVESAILVEYKATRQPNPSFESQALGYLWATRLEVGLLLYFNCRASFKRLIYTNDRKLLPPNESAGPLAGP